MNGSAVTASAFLIETLFSLYSLVVLLRLILGAVQADPYNPLSQFVIKLTSPLLTPLRRLVPAMGRLDTAAVVLLFALSLVKLALLATVGGLDLPLGALLSLTILGVLGLVLDLYFFAILIQALLSWINPNPHHPAARLLEQITAPVLRPLRQAIPLIGGIDLSPLAALIAIQFLRILLPG